MHESLATTIDFAAICASRAPAITVITMASAVNPTWTARLLIVSARPSRNSDSASMLTTASALLFLPSQPTLACASALASSALTSAGLRRPAT